MEHYEIEHSQKLRLRSVIEYRFLKILKTFLFATRGFPTLLKLLFTYPSITRMTGRVTFFSVRYSSRSARISRNASLVT